MTTEQLEQLMQAHKCGFCVFTCDEGYACEMTSAPEQGEDVLGHGIGPSIVEAVYEALKSKCKDRAWMLNPKDNQWEENDKYELPPLKEFLEP